MINVSSVFLILVFVHSSLYAQPDRNSTQHDSIEKDQIREIIQDPFISEEPTQTINQVFQPATTDKKSIWDVITPLLIGAALTFLVQIFIEWKKSKKEKINQIIELKSNLKGTTSLVSFLYKSLAMHKAHSKYWYAHFDFEENSTNPNEHEKRKFYDLHIVSLDKSVEVEKEIAKLFSEYVKQVNKLQVLTVFDERVENLIEKYRNCIPRKPRSFTSKDRDKLKKLSNKEEKRLKSEYIKCVSFLEEANAILKIG